MGYLCYCLLTCARTRDPIVIVIKRRFFTILCSHPQPLQPFNILLKIVGLWAHLILEFGVGKFFRFTDVEFDLFAGLRLIPARTRDFVVVDALIYLLSTHPIEGCDLVGIGIIECTFGVIATRITRIVIYEVGFLAEPD